MQPPFFLREKPSDGVLKLLSETVLGTNGARYKHLNTDEIIQQLDEPMFLSLERKGKALSNITFCRRRGDWYIRYFAFANFAQASKKGKEAQQSNGILKQSVARFFDQKLQEEAQCFYGYIDPNNAKSRWMSENFGFKHIATLITQSFSRRKPKLHKGFEILTNDAEIASCMTTYSEHLFYTDYHAKRVKFAAIRDEHDQIIAFAKYQKAHWRIDALPGKWGKTLVQVLPYVPVLSGIFNPKNHRFLVPEAVQVKDNNPDLLIALLESILAHENYKLMLWWMDERESLWQDNKKRVRWGIFHRLLKNPPVNVYARFEKTDYQALAKEQLIYVSGMDLI